MKRGQQSHRGASESERKLERNKLVEERGGSEKSPAQRKSGTDKEKTYRKTPTRETTKELK